MSEDDGVYPYRLFVPIALACVIAPSVLWYPEVAPWSDEASYVSTAFKMADQLQVTAATHLPEDVLRSGTDHKPVHMPAYLVALAAWLEVFPKPAAALWLNRLLFAAALVLLHRISRIGRSATGTLSGLAFAVLLATPLGLAYANTAMMEAFVLFVGALFVAAWLRLRERPAGLYLLWASTALCFLTRETLVLLPAAVFLADRRTIVDAHRALRRRSRIDAVALPATVLLLTALSVTAFVGRGYYPNFLSELNQAPDLSARTAMVMENLTRNLGFFLKWHRFPHDLPYGYGLAIFGGTLALAIRGRPGAVGRLDRALAIFWASSLAVVCLFYDNFDWRSHRVLSICVALGTAAILNALSSLEESPRLRMVLLCGMLVVSSALAASVSRALIATRSPIALSRQLATASRLAMPGDLLFANGGFEFLVENPRAELMWRLPETDAELAAAIERARPRFVLLDEAGDLGLLGYRRLGGRLWVRAQ